MALVGKDAAMVGYRKTGVSIFLLGGDTGCPSVCSRFLGAVVLNHEEGGEYPCGVPTIYHRESGKMAGQRVMGDTFKKEGNTGIGDAVVGHVQILLASEGSTVGGPKNTLVGLHTVN